MSARIRPDWDIRDAILDMGGTDAYKCYQCGKCMAVCPWYHVESVVFPVYRTPQSVKLPHHQRVAHQRGQHASHH